VSSPPKAYRVSGNPRGCFAFRPRGRGPIWRWDDPFDIYGVLYMAETKRAAYVEFFGDLRPAPGMQTAIREVSHDTAGLHETTVGTGEISKDSLDSILVGEAELSEAIAADVTAFDSVQELRGRLWDRIQAAGLADLSVAIIQGRDYRITQAISRILYTDPGGYGGIRCPSYYGTDLICWTFFQGDASQLKLRVVAPSFSVGSVTLEDPELRAAFETLRLRLV
jgi:hypothetical protein